MSYEYETPRERRQRCLHSASRAHEIAAGASFKSVRERYRELETHWLTLAKEIPGLAALETELEQLHEKAPTR